METQNQNMKHILIVPDKFKGSLTSLQAAQAIRKGLEKRYAAGDCAAATAAAAASVAAVGASAETSVDAGHTEGAICAQGASGGHTGGGFCAREEDCGAGLQFQSVEIADGGDGSLDVVAGRVESPQKVYVKVHDPLFREVTSQILLYGGEDSPLCAFIEMAKISGLAMLEQHERNPLNTSTYGFGEAIRKAQEMGAKKITLSIGGSATDDCGAGMLQALGLKFFNRAGELMPVPICGKDLQDIGRIATPEESVGKILFGSEAGCKIEVICDVDNPLLGENGATAVYAPQKGATPQAMEMLERGKANLASVAERCLHILPQMKLLPGAGAAGGVGYAGTAFLGGKLLSGWRFFTEITSLEEKVQWADVVVTGEGSVDSQSLSGKIVGGIMELAQKYGKPVEIFCGVSSLQELPQGVRCHSLVSIEPDKQMCMTHAAELLERLAEGVELY